MPTTQDEVGEIPGSRSRAGRRKRRRPRRTPVPDCSGEAQPEAAPLSQRSKRKASPEPSAAASQQQGKSEALLEPSEGSKRGKGSKKREGTSKKKAATSTGEQAAPASPGASHASSSSSAVSSPLRWPHPPAYIQNPENANDPAMKDALEAYDELKCKYRAKRKLQQQLPTLDMSICGSCMANENLQSVRESTTKTILQAAKVIFSFSSYVGM